MGWGIAGGVLGLLLMFGAYKWLSGWAVARTGGMSIPTIGTRPRRLAGVPEEAPLDAKMPPGMVIMRQGDSAVPVVVDTTKPEAAPVAMSSPETASEPDEVVIETVASGAESGVEIREINQASQDQGEFVVLSNSGAKPVALEGWKLSDEGEKHVYAFPAIVLQPDASIRVHMWRGEDTDTDLFVGRRNRWWNDTGDTASLHDAEGVLVHQLATHTDEE